MSTKISEAEFNPPVVPPLRRRDACGHGSGDVDIGGGGRGTTAGGESPWVVSAGKGGIYDKLVDQFRPM